MRKVVAIRRKSLWFIVGLLVMGAFLLSACGGATSTGSGASATPAPTTVKGYGLQHGCPSDLVLSNTPAPASVTVKPADSRKTISVHKGDTIQFELPFGQLWSGPRASQGALQLQSPWGYAWSADNACVWRFTAQGSGTTQIDFSARALCKPNEMCAQYIIEMPFTISVS